MKQVKQENINLRFRTKGANNSQREINNNILIPSKVSLDKSLVKRAIQVI